ARRNNDRSLNSYPSRRPRPARSGSLRSWLNDLLDDGGAVASPASGGLDPLVDVVDGIAHRLQVGKIFVLDAEPDASLAELLLERLDQLDQRQRVGVEVVDERLPLADRRRVDLEDVGEAVAHDFK